MPTNLDRMLIGVIGTATGTEEEHRIAHEVGQRVAQKGWILINGGLSGVMEHASRGAVEAGGLVVGILPGATAESANPWIQIPIVTNMGHARNVIIAHTSQALIAVGGGEGTLSEMAIGIKLNKPVASIGSWELPSRVFQVKSAQEAVDWVEHHLHKCYDRSS